MATSRNGCFQLIHNGNHTFLKIYPPKGEGKPVSIKLITRYFDFIRLTDYNLKDIKVALENCNEPVEIMVSPKEIYPHNELMFIDTDEMKMKAVCTFIPPSSKGKLMGKKEIIDTLFYSGIKHGIQEEIIERYVNGRLYCTEIVMARGTSVVEGKSAIIKYNFSTKLETKPKMLEDGTVDFHQLDIINNVNAGDVLAVMEPMVEGIPGKDVFGNTVLPKKVRNAVMKHGKNIHLSQDKLTMYSDIDGHVSLAGDSVFVSNVYEVPADVGVASGNIKYSGSVEVKGNVISGFVVEADGDIVVNGVVEGATLIAGGQIFLKRGIQGMGKGELIAGGNIVSRFMENCTAKAGGDILSDVILHSNVVAAGNIMIQGKKGLVTGGKIKASGGITVRTAGSTMGTRTELIIRMDDSILEECKILEEQIHKINEEQEKYLQIIAMYQKRAEVGKETEELIKAAKIAKLQIQKIQMENNDKIARYKLLKNEIQYYRPGKVKVENIAYPGLEIKINSEILRLRNEVVRSQFVLEGVDIKPRPLL